MSNKMKYLEDAMNSDVSVAIKYVHKFEEMMQNHLEKSFAIAAKYLSIFIFTIASSLKTENPCKKPLGINNCFLFSLLSSIEIYLPKLGLPTLKSTATSKILPCNALTSFDCA